MAPEKSEVFYPFQIVINRNSKSFVKLDTTSIDSKRIIDSYRDSDSYEIIHIPDFKTKMRVVDRNSLIAEHIAMPEISHEIQDLDANRLLEFYAENDDDLKLSWGKMLSMKRVGNFSFKEFERSYNQDFVLTHKDEFLRILKYELIIPTGNEVYKKFETDSNKYYKIQELLNKLDPVNTIYIDNIVIEKDGEMLLLPYQFSYSFE